MAALLAAENGLLLTLELAHPDLRRLFPRLRSLHISDDGLDAPGNRVRALSSRIEKLRNLRGKALVAHDDVSHEAASVAAAAGGLPVIRVVHTAMDWTPEDHRRAFHLYSPMTSLYFCVEEKTYQYARRHGLPSRRIPQPICLNRLQQYSTSKQMPEIPASFQILFVGRLEWAKGTDVLIEAFGLLPRIWNAHLYIAGNGPELPNLKYAVRKFKILEHVHFLGYRKDVATLYRSADLVVLPSRSEGIPLVALEALACGTPVLVTRVGSLPELFRKYGLSACLQPTEDPQALAIAMEQFYRNPATLRRKVRKISSLLIQQHDSRVVAKRARQAIEKILGI